jgi:hypothetical protein
MKFWMVSVLMGMACMACGCLRYKLDVDYDFDVSGGGDMKILEAIGREQTIKVSGSAAPAPVNVFIYLDKNKTNAGKEILTMKFSPIILANDEKTENFNLEATIPANEMAVVHVTRAGTATHVKLKITNK